MPKEYDIYQPVADTCGPGGAVRSLRAIPQYREIAAAVREQCPDAWVLNYTNPMTVCTRALYEEYPDINAIGLCHEVFHIQILLAELAEKYIDEAEDVAGSEIDVNVKGINHFTWIDEATWYGHDVFQYLDDELEVRKPLPSSETGDLEDADYWINHHEIAFDLYDTFGLLGAAGDRHLVEFVPWYLDIDEPAEIQRWGFRLTPSSARVSDSDDGPAKMDTYLADPEEFEFTQSGEEAVDIMRALVGLEALKTNVNHPNVGRFRTCPTVRSSSRTSSSPARVSSRLRRANCHARFVTWSRPRSTTRRHSSKPASRVISTSRSRRSSTNRSSRSRARTHRTCSPN